MTNETRRNH